MFGQDVSENCSEKIGCINIIQAVECGSQNEEVVQWLEFPPSLRLGQHGRAHCIRITRIHYRSAPLVDFALYFLLHSVLYWGEQCIRVILRYQDGGHTLLPRYQHQTEAPVIKGGCFRRFRCGSRLGTRQIYHSQIS